VPQRYTFFCIKKEHLKKPFLPRFNKQKARSETSVYLIDDLTEQDIWNLGQTCVAALAQESENKSARESNRPPHIFKLLGRYDFEQDSLVKNMVSLCVEIDDIPCTSHSNLLNWIAGVNLGKATNELTARKLKENCALYVPCL
jgi:hypothetical protein